MEGRARRREILELLSKVKLAIGSEKAHYILEFILVAVNNGKLTLSSTNLEQYLSIPCQISADNWEGRVCVEPKPLERFLRSIADEEVKFKIEKNGFFLEAGEAWLFLQGRPAEDFPEPLQTFFKEEGNEIKISGFSEALSEVAYAMPPRAAYLQGLSNVCFGSLKSGIELAATDGHRIAVRTLKTTVKLPYQFFLPAEAARVAIKLKMNRVVLRLTKELDNYVTITEESGIKLGTRLVLRKFPNYQPLLTIPKKSSTLTLNSEELGKGVKAVSGLAIPRLRSVDFDLKREELVISSEGHDFSRAVVKVKAKGEMYPLRLDWKYLQDILERVTGEVEIRTTDCGGYSDRLFIFQRDTKHILMGQMR